MLPQLLILSVLIFVLAEMMPGSPLTGLIDPNISREQIEAQREKLGLNRPAVERYFDWIWNALQGNFGRSFQHKRPVIDIIGQRIMPTLWLSIFTTTLIYLVALPLGILSGRYNNSLLDRAVNVYNFIAYSIPRFVVALLLLWFFGYHLNVLPTRGTVGSGLQPGTVEFVVSRFQHMILPAITGALLGTTGTIQILRSGIIDAKSEDYVRTAKAKGVPEDVIYRKHIFRNSILPIAAFFGFELTSLIGGSVITEQIFTYQGMGQLFITSVTGRDYSVMITLTLLFGLMTLLGSLLSDIIMVFVDPRIRMK